jgi:hypothetical protein
MICTGLDLKYWDFVKDEKLKVKNVNYGWFMRMGISSPFS